MHSVSYRNKSNVIDDGKLVDLSGMEGVEYDIVLDQESEELVSQYVDENDLQGEGVEDVETALEHVRNDFDHVTTLAREKSLLEGDTEDMAPVVDQERREAQGPWGADSITFSNVLNGSYDATDSEVIEPSEEGYMAGGCIERAIMMNYVLEDLGFDTELRMGNVRIPEDDGEYTTVGHAWTQADVDGTSYTVDAGFGTETDVAEWTEVTDQYDIMSYGVT